MTLMQHFLMANNNQTAHTRTSRDLDTSCFWHVIVITAFIWLGLVSEGLASHTVSPTSLTFYAVQGATNPPKQTLTFTRASTYNATLTASDNATWLTVSPTSQSETGRATITVAINTSTTSTPVAGTYKATITVKEGTWYTKTVTVTLILSPPLTSTTTTTTKSATLAWNAVTGATVSGYDVYVGTAPSLYTTKTNVGNVTTYTVNSLNVGTTYYFAVTAYNSAGESVKSNEVSKTIY